MLTRGATAPLSTYSVENVLRSRLAALGIGLDLFAALAGTNQSRLSRAVRGLAPLSADEAQRYLRLTEELQQLAAMMQPFQIVFADPRVIASLLEDFRARHEHWARLEAAMVEIRRCVESGQEFHVGSTALATGRQ